MNAIKMSEEINHQRRRFLGSAATTIAAAQFGVFGSAEAELSEATPADLPAVKPGTNTSFASLKQIDAGLLNIGYAEAGPADGSVVILLHGGPMTFTALSTLRPCWHRRATG